jgi:hypothetical protein
MDMGLLSYSLIQAKSSEVMMMKDNSIHDFKEKVEAFCKYDLAGNASIFKRYFSQVE